MSRVGQRPIILPEKVKIQIQGESIHVEGPKGTLSHQFPTGISIAQEEGRLLVKRASNEKKFKSLHGLNRTLVDNMIQGVMEGFSKQLEIQGVGYRAQVTEKKLELNVGFTHPVVFQIPEGITIEAPKPTQLVIKGVSKYLVGQVAARIRAFAPPEPYKGKGIRYLGEQVRRKAGKAVA